MVTRPARTCLALGRRVVRGHHGEIGVRQAPTTNRMLHQAATDKVCITPFCYNQFGGNNLLGRGISTCGSVALFIENSLEAYCKDPQTGDPLVFRNFGAHYRHFGRTADALVAGKFILGLFCIEDPVEVAPTNRNLQQYRKDRASTGPQM